MIEVTRRTALFGSAALAGGILSAPAVRAQPAGLLAALRKAGVVKVAVPQTPPWSEVKPDGSLVGIAPDIFVPAIKAIGIPAIQPIPATYAELIPGLAAGRWDICGASLTISKARCNAVAFPSPVVFGYLAVAYRSDELKNPPLSLADAGRSGLKIATNAGGFQLAALRRVTTPDNLLLFNDTSSVVEAVASKRADIAIDAYHGMAQLNTHANIAFTPALTDMGYTASGIALRKTDTDLYEALDAEIRKLKASGFVAQVNKKYGTPYDRAAYDRIEGAAACESTVI